MKNRNGPNTPCPICGTDEASERRGEFGRFGISYCMDCQLQYANPMEEPGETFYTNCSLYESRANNGLLQEPERDWRYRTSLKLCAAKQRQSLLDIGCGEGAFLSLAQKQGYNVYGLDLDSRAVESARKRRGLEHVECGAWTELAAKEGWRDFQVVTLFDIMEHVADPVALVRQVHGLLRSGGMVCITVPRLDRYPRIFDPLADSPPHHLTLWTAQALKRTLERAGFVDIRVEPKPLKGEDFASIVTWRIKQLLGAGQLSDDNSVSVIESEKCSGNARSTKNWLRAALRAVMSVPAGLLRVSRIGRGCTLMVIASRR